MGANWRHLGNTTEPSMCVGDAACCQITLTTCYFWVHQHKDAGLKIKLSETTTSTVYYLVSKCTSEGDRIPFEAQCYNQPLKQEHGF